MKNIGFANWLAIGAALLLAFAFFFLPILLLPALEEAGEKLSITGFSLLIRSFPTLEYPLPEVLWLGAAVFAGIIGAALSFLPFLHRTARFIAQIVGVAAIFGFGVVPVFYTGSSDVILAQSLASGFWLGMLAAVLLVLQGFIGGKPDTISDSVSAFRKNIHITRRQIIAVILLAMGVLAVVEAFTVNPEAVSRMTYTPSRFGVEDGVTLPFGEYPLASQNFMLSVGFFVAYVGFLVLVNRPFLEKLYTPLMIVAGLSVIALLLIYVTAGRSFNVSTLITESLRTAVPIAIGAMAGIWCERSGVVNIAIEGMMLFGAAFGFGVLFFLRNSYPEQDYVIHMVIAVIGAILSGGLIAMLHSWLSITFGIDQIVSGTVINILALGSTSYLRSEVLLSNLSGTNRLPAIQIPFLSDLPVVGPVFSSQPIFYAMFIVIILTHVILFQTRWGLRTRAIGENPHAADTLGIKVNRMRWINVMIGGMIAGLAGAWFSLEATGRFTDGMTDGKGYISLAAMIFGKWTPSGSLVGALLFGFSEVMGNNFQIYGVQLPPQFLQMVPYIVTLIVLAGLVGRAIPPKAVGKPYKKEE